MDLNELVDDVIAGRPVTPEEALVVLRLPDAETLALVAAVGRVRHHHSGTMMEVNYLINLKSSLCLEDCFYYSQRLGSQADILKYRWLRNEDTVAAAKTGIAGGARRVYLVASGHEPSNHGVDKVTEIIGKTKAEHPDMEICACLGQLREEQPERLAAAEADAYNHNLNTAGSHYDSICTAHSYQDRTETVQHAREHGLGACSDLVAGIGESGERLVGVTFALRGIGADSAPVNFLMPFDGTPLAGHADLSPQRCLRVLVMMRFVHPDSEMRVAAGRKQHLRNLQPLSLGIYNSLFPGDYLTSEERTGAKDPAMIAGYGFTVLGQKETSPEVDIRPVIRNRGVGAPEPVSAQGHFRGKAQARRLKSERMPSR